MFFPLYIAVQEERIPNEATSQQANSPTSSGLSSPPQKLGSPQMYETPSPDTSTSSAQLSIPVLVNADIQYEGHSESMKKRIRFEEILEESSWLKVVEWSNYIPAFGTLSLDDQIKLLKSSWCEHCTLKLATQIIKLKSEENIEDPEVNRVLGELAYCLECLGVDHVELACLKGLLLFNPSE